MRYASAVAATLAVCVLAACSTHTGTPTPTTAPPAPSGTGESAPPQTRLTPANLEALMKKIGPAYQSMRDDLQGNETARAADEARRLAEWFGEVEKFWAQNNRDDAVKWAGQARNFATETAGAAVNGNGQKASVVATNMAGACKQCHGTYRESDGKGGYRIKGGVVAAR
jgi:hypothetical protein